MVSTSANSINVSTAGLVKFDGTNTFSTTTITQHDLLIGSTSNAITSVAPSATSGVPVISQGAAADPTFGTAVVAGDGTGATSFIANGAVISNTTTTGALASIALASQKFLVGTSGAPAAKTLSVVNQVFTSSGTYTPTTGMVYCSIFCLGGGGGSGGCATTGVTTIAAAGGGGCGGHATGIFSSSTIGASQTVTIGAAGAAGAAGNNNGGTGGTTSVGALISATGGVGGTGSAAAANPLNLGGGGGSGSGGDFQTTGTPGFIGAGAFNTAAFLFGGAGGSSFFGGGGNASANSAAVAATSYGGGGGGGSLFTSLTQIAGAAGFKGVVIITEFVIA